MKEVTLVDTAVASTNLGDQIIMQACEYQLRELTTNSFAYRIASHEWMGKKSRQLVKRSAHTIVCGTNLLSSRMWYRPLWKVQPMDALSGLDFTLFGPGWYQHQKSGDFYTRFLLKQLLSKNALHSVRDEYTKTQLVEAGVSNVVNTGCPTLWQLDNHHCDDIPSEKSEVVVTTINTYIKDPEQDKKLISILKENYKKVFLWVQTFTDYEYAKGLSDGIEFLAPSLASLDDFLVGNKVDYVGNRLHAGIRAMQHKRRSIIIEIDNRAYEMGRDFSLPTVKRDDFERLSSLIETPFTTKVTLPEAEISRWKQQFDINTQ